MAEGGFRGKLSVPANTSGKSGANSIGGSATSNGFCSRAVSETLLTVACQADLQAPVNH